MPPGKGHQYHRVQENEMVFHVEIGEQRTLLADPREMQDPIQGSVCRDGLLKIGRLVPRTVRGGSFRRSAIAMDLYVHPAVHALTDGP